MKRSKHEGIINAAGRHFSRRNFADSDILKKNKLKLKQSVEQFENTAKWSQRMISVENFNLSEQDAEHQFLKLKAWVESLSANIKIEMDEILFPAFISLYRRLMNVSGNAAGARGFYSRNQSNYLKVPELRKMAERFVSENNSHFILELSSESFEVLNSYIGSNTHPLLQQLLNTTLEIHIMKTKIDTNTTNQPTPKSNVDSSNMEEVHDLLAAISRLKEVPPPAPVLKLYSIDTGQRKMSAASASPFEKYLSCGFQDSSVAIWDVKKLRSPSKSDLSRLDLSEACAISVYHPLTSTSATIDPESCVSVCLGHSGPVYATQFTPTNTHVLSCSDDTTLRLWEISSMENVCVYRGHTYPVWDVNIAQNGQFFASASQDRTAKIWMFDRTYPLRILAGHTADVDCVAFHPNGLYVATGSADSCVRMWNVTDGKSVRILVGHCGTVLTVAFSPCGTLLASAGEDHRVMVWDVAAGRILHDYAGHQHVIHGLVWISEHVLCSYSADGSIRVWNVTLPSSSTPASQQKELGAYSIPSPTKIVHIGRGYRNSIFCITASD